MPVYPHYICMSYSQRKRRSILELFLGRERYTDSLGFDRDIVHYCMSKAAVLAFHEGLAAELRIKRLPEIKLTCVHPSWAATPMTAPYRSALDHSGIGIIEPQSVADAVVNQILSGRGKQILLAGGLGWIAGIRAWPSWLSGSLAVAEGK
jgi:NAD(P)-dependent dehydrogenase (short-subunit alcohol dehydrogenase family)